MATKKIPLESSEQQRFVLKLRWCYPEIVFFAIPNGGKRTPREARKLVLEGVEAGTPDIFIAEAVEPHHGLFLEFKRRTGSKTSIAQKQKIKDLESKRYKCAIVKGHDEAIKVLDAYLNKKLTVDTLRRT